MPFHSGSMAWVSDKPKKSVAPKSAPKSEPVEDDGLKEIVSDLSVAEVIELVESGEANLAEVIAAEKEGKNRKTILNLVQSDSGKVYARQQD